jgi:GT2 family glycosyltransferase
MGSERMRYVLVIGRDADLSLVESFLPGLTPWDTVIFLHLFDGTLEETDDALHIPLQPMTRPQPATLSQKGAWSQFENWARLRLPKLLSFFLPSDLQQLRDNLEACDPDVIDLRLLGLIGKAIELALAPYFPYASLLTLGSKIDRLGNAGNWRRYDPSVLVSIVLPVYNGSRYMRTSIESCLRQTHECFELILVDDCSNDDSLAIMNEYATRDHRIRVLSNESNRGLPESLNVGFANTRGTFLTWTSDDNAYDPNALKYMAAHLCTFNEVSMVYCGMRVIDSQSVAYKIVLPKHPWYLREGNVVGACFMYRRDVSKAVGSYDPSFAYAEDYEYWVRIAKASIIRNLYQPLYSYRIHSESLSKAHRDRWPELNAKIYAKHFSSGGVLSAWSAKGPERLPL